ncbi:MAG: hypothetical protein EOO53_01700 [Gammaproteobacteria bacterium]|nr:MAG: hypothetical protein EOO53_01700 [Gammaproteobacteria bacterium]
MNALKRIVVVGRDADGWITAFMLQKTIAAHKLDIELEFLELPSDVNDGDFFSVQPSHRLLHDMLGAKEQTLLRLSGGMYSFGQRYNNWFGNGSSYMQSFDRSGVDFNQVPFYHYWQKAANSGLKLPFEAFNVGAAAALAGRYVVFEQVGSTFSHASSGYQFEARAYIATIAKAAIAAGLKHRATGIHQVKQSDLGISALVLSDGSEVTADLFIDASGYEALLINQLASGAVESWASAFPVDRLIVASAPKLTPLPAFNQISAFKAGWVGIYPLLNKTTINIACSSKHGKTSDVLERVSASIGMKLFNPVETLFAANHRPNPWVKNCIALGSAATNLEPLDGTHLLSLHLGLSALRGLLPQYTDCAAEAAIFNRSMNKQMESVRDYLLARYKLNKRFGDAFWDAARAQTVPDTLAYRIDLFKSRGVIAQMEDDVFIPEDWLALFVGNQLSTSNLDALIDKIPDDELMSKFQQLLTYIKTEVEKMPLLQSYTEMTL